MPILFNREVCQNLPTTIEKEWLESNGIGGYASSTIIGANTRRYHGLLTAATKPPLGRVLLLSKLEEILCIGEREYPLSTNVYPHTIYPEGYKNLIQFRLKPFPTFQYSIHGINIEKTVFMLSGENTTVILYQVGSTDSTSTTPVPLFLKVRVMVAFRDYHWLTHENPTLETGYEVLAHGICLRPYKTLPPMYLFHNAQSIDNVTFWYKNVEYSKEMERGLEAHEDYYSPFALHFDFCKRKDCYIVASTNRYDTLNVFELLNKEIESREKIGRDWRLKVDNPGLHSSTLTQGSLPKESAERIEKLKKLTEYLWSTSKSFIVKRENDKKSIIAGYHWFGDWGRDTMISLPGLTLIQGRFEEAREILLSYARYVSKGMIPNRFPDYGEMPEYNTVDASLWYIHAVYQYLHFSNDLQTMCQLYDVLREIIECYQKGTRYNIHMDRDGLIYAGADGIQLTWMDAKVGDWVVTPRMGKAVEVNALWYNALKIMSFFSQEMRLNNESVRYNTLAQKVSESFNEAFWFHEGRYLYDYVDGEIKNNAIRPNQVFAISLPYSMLSRKRQESIMEVVKGHLLTPFGLRSLSPEDKDYLGRHLGNPYERDKSYHQGAVWAWLIGPYISAYARVYADRKETRDDIERLLEPFYGHLYEAGLGTISEIFDGDFPHTPRGCISQAWSVAEILRVCFEYVF